MVLLSLAAVTVAAFAASGGFSELLKKDARAPNFSAQTVEGKKFALSDLRGRVVLLDFWAAWCPACRAEVPELEKLWKRYKDRGLIVVGIALESGGARAVARFAQDNKLTYWQVSDDQGRIAEKYRIRPIPTTFIVDQKGFIRHSQVGFGPGGEKDLAKRLEVLLPRPEAAKE